MPKKLTYKYVKEQIEKEGYKLLSKEYINSKTKLELQCPSGHEYSVRFSSFQRGRRCPVCAKNNKKLTYEYVKEQIEKEGYKLLSKEYINANTKLELQCLEGHEYSVRFNHFHKGIRCPVCAENKKKTYEEVKQYIESQGYKLLSKEYINTHTPLLVKCPKNHEYLVRFSNFQQGNRCSICVGKKKKTYEEVKQYIESQGYKLLSKEYKNADTKLELQCPKNHIYEATWASFYTGYRCSKCSHRISKAEQEIHDYLKSYFPDIKQSDREIIKPKELDIVIPSKKIAIEYCGLYWHSDKYRDKNYHLDKLQKCNKAGYNLITIFENEYTSKPEVVKYKLLNLLGVSNNIISSTDCKIREIAVSPKNKFLNKYSLRDKDKSDIQLGAFYKNKLVAIMTFEHNQFWELSRFCVNTNYTVPNIERRLYGAFIRKYHPNMIRSYSDKRWLEDKFYTKLGFKEMKTVAPKNIELDNKFNLFNCGYTIWVWRR